MNMKRITGLAVALVCASAVQAKPLTNIDVASLKTQTAKVLAQTGLFSEAQIQQISWQVGEYHAIDIELEGMGNLGSGTKSVTKDVPEEGAFWYVNDMTLMGQNQKSEALIRRADGKTLKLIVNGQEQDPEQGAGGEVEIIEQYQTTVTVPAGTFDCFYIKAKITPENGEAQNVELWINPTDVNLDGMLKVQFETQFGKLSMILKEFGKK